jgi:hypothetical protein
MLRDEALHRERILRYLQRFGPQTDKRLRHALGIWWFVPEGFRAIESLERDGLIVRVLPSGRQRRARWSVVA